MLLQAFLRQLVLNFHNNKLHLNKEYNMQQFQKHVLLVIFLFSCRYTKAITKLSVTLQGLFFGPKIDCTNGIWPKFFISFLFFHDMEVYTEE